MQYGIQFIEVIVNA